ncbi:MAG TPA: MraY family glycosyltransferase [Roseiflexaceae bacterium]|nr:MraY family glycosyltransferase [Roseiflexaceae bacterium]
MTLVTLFALVATFVVALALTALLMPPVMRLCERRGWVATPGGRRLHARPTPTIGGIAIYTGFVLTVGLTFALAPIEQLRRSPVELLRIGLVLLGATVIFAVMWLDDVVELRPLPKLVGQIVAALIAVGPFLWDQTLYTPDDQARGIILTAFNFPLVGKIHLYHLSPWIAIGATLFWIAGMNNTINFSDGMDGLAGGISLIAALALALHAVRLGQYTVALLPLALAGACAGFLLFNFPPARIFMGDSGAHLLAYVLATSAILGGAKLATVLLVLGVPILDVAWLIVSRLSGGHSPAHGGRDHLHHRLIDLGFSPRQILAFYYTLSASFGLLGVADTPQLVKLVALVLLGLIAGAVLIYAARRAPLKEVGSKK